MGRPPALNDRQKAEIGRRLAQGEGMSALAREFKVGLTTLKRNFSDHVTEIRNVANALAQTELVMESMPVSVQVSVRSLADSLKGISLGAAKAADIGMQTAHILQTRALRSVQRLDDDSTPEDLRFPDALLTVGNKATQLGLGLMAANKGAVPDAADTNREALLRDIAAMMPN